MRKTGIYFTIAIMTVLTSCYNLGPCIEGTGPVTEETRDVSGFYSVSNTTSFDVYVSQADSFSVVVSAKESLLPVIETYKSGGTLLIKTREFSCIRNASDVKIYVTLPEIEELHLTGSGSLECDKIIGDMLELSLTSSGRLTVDSVFCDEVYIKQTSSGVFSAEQMEVSYAEVKLTGSGNLSFGDIFTDDIVLNLTSSGTIRGGIFDVQNTDISISGSGRIILRGDSDELISSHTSSGRMDALDVFAVDVRTHSTGSGNTYVNVSGVLDLTILGSGDVIYLGSPTDIISRVTGSGNFRPY